MSSCSCVYVDGDGESRLLCESQPVARRQHTCCECGRTIKHGEKYATEVVVSDGFGHYKTCLDCYSVRDAFFCDGFFFTEMWQLLSEHIHDVVVHGDGISSDCIVGLTPRAREMVCDIIEDCWADTEEES